MPLAEHDRDSRRLHEWQSVLQACIVEPGQDRAALRSWLPPGAKDADTRLDVYASAYVLRLGEALRCNYPALHQALGDADFDAMARRFVERCPSTQASIRWFGAGLDEFLRGQEPWSRVPVLGELAAFEWAIRHTIDAADADRLSVADLLAVPAEAWAELCFDLHPSVTLLFLEWNAPPLWHALTGTEPARPGETTTPVRHPLHWLVYRKPDLSSGWRSLPDAEQAALEQLRQGTTFAGLCEHIARQGDDDAALQAATWLRAWVEQGLLARRQPAGRLA
jgi:hypothetical protein